MFSARTERQREENALSERARTLITAGHALLDLTVSNPTLVDLPYPEEALGEALRQGARHGYTPDSKGLRSARECIARLGAAQGTELDPEHVILTASTSEAYSLAFKVLADPGDDVLVPEPSYPLIEHLAAFEGVHARPYRLAYDGVWHIDFDSVRRAMTPRTRALIVVSPNNPTGSYVKRAEFELCAEFGVPIVSDEVFAEFPLDVSPSERSSASRVAAPLSITLDGLSKRAALPQMKLAWMALRGEPALVDEALARLELVADMFLSPNTPVQHALPELLACTRPVVGALEARLRNNLAALRAALEGSAASVLRVEGGWSAIVRLPDIVGDWAEHLLDKEHLIVQPGWFYDLGGAHIVVSLLTESARLETGAARLAKCVEEGA